MEGITVIDEAVVKAPGMLHTPFRAEAGGFFTVQQGWFRFLCNQEAVTCYAGSLYFIARNKVYTIEEVSDNFIYTGITIDAAFLQANGIHIVGSDLFQVTMAGNTRQYLLSAAETAAFCELLGTIRFRLQAGYKEVFQQHAVQHLVIAAIYEAGALFRLHSKGIHSPISRKEELTSRFLDLLHLHFRQERGIAFYADALAVTAGYLTKALKEVTGKAASDLISAAVIAEAKMMLGNPAISVSEAADELEFSDQSFFGKYFKKHTGLSPSDYKRESRSIAARAF